MTKAFPPYTDGCPYCPARTVVAPLARFASRSGAGVVATYECPTGHRWWTGWAWWQNREHETAGREAAA